MRPIKVMEMGAAGGGGLGAVIPEDTYVLIAFDPADATTNIQFSTDGTCAVSAGVTPAPPNWKAGSGVSSDYEIRWTNTSGTLSTGTVSTWLPMGQVFGVTRTILGTKTCTGTVEIRMSASPFTVLATGSITLEATVEI